MVRDPLRRRLDADLLGAPTDRPGFDVTAPFTAAQFMGVFAAYNAAIWPAQVIAAALGVLALGALAAPADLRERLILSILAVLWAWCGIGYHLLFFSAISPAANLFAAVFVAQALLLAAAAIRPSDLRIRAGWNSASAAGLLIVVYALAIYPMIGALAGHGGLAGPVFGVAPCPTTIFTLGLLVMARGGWVVWLSVIPILWALIGVAAAVQLGIPEDLALPVAGGALVTTLVLRALHARRTARRHAPAAAPARA